MVLLETYISSQAEVDDVAVEETNTALREQDRDLDKKLLYPRRDLAMAWMPTTEQSWPFQERNLHVVAYLDREATVFRELVLLTLSLLFFVRQYLTAVILAPDEVFSTTNLLALLYVLLRILTDFDRQLVWKVPAYLSLQLVPALRSTYVPVLNLQDT